MLTSPAATQVRAAYVLANNTPIAVTVQVRTLSSTEALVIATEPLDGQRMVFFLEVEHQEACLLDCDVVHRSEYHQRLMGGREVDYSAYRLRFSRKLAKSAVHESLMSMFPITDVEAAANQDEIRAQQPQLMPLLSAIGILVVHVWGTTL